MSSKLTKVVANFETSLATKLGNGAVAGALTSITDKNSVALPNGRYCMIVDRGTGDEEHLLFDLTGNAIANIVSVSRQGVQTAGVQNLNGHRAGAKCYLTDFINLKVIVDILNGADTLDAANPLRYDADPSFNDGKQVVTKKYADDQSAGKVGKTGNENIAGVKTFQDRPIFQSGLTSNTPVSAADPVGSNDVATKQWVLALAFGGAALISGLNSPQINYDRRGRVRSVHDLDNGKTYVLTYDPGDVLRSIFDGTNIWVIQYKPDGALQAISKR
ncbi:MAG: hypothetical protein AB203_01845 [Parcubacteria bacterium C7867-008]|nr:MAG: hypothetical protein AB203_01845 [Parcubacteria bacterium C7867-008]